MTNNVDALTYIAKRLFWAIQPEQLSALVRVLLTEDNPVLTGFAHRASILKAVADVYRSTSPVSGKTAVIPVVGPLSNDRVQSYWDGGTCYLDIQDELAEAVKDSSVSEILLLVDSPGGEVMGCPETADAIFAARQVKPVCAMVSGDCASAAYYLTSQASNITVTPSGEVGSVGVLMVHADITKMLDEAGVKLTPIFAGKYKTELWPFTPLSEDAKAAAQSTIDEMYAGFLGAISRGRGKRVTAEMAADNYGNGRMMSAKDALAGGLVDGILTLRETIQERKDRNRAVSEHQARKRALELMGLE